MTFFGGTGGLGDGVCKILSEQKKHEVTPIGSKLLNLTECESADIELFFLDNPTQIAVIFSNFNFNSFIHKYHGVNYDALDEQFAVNVRGITKLISGALSFMRGNKYGRIIIASSVTVDVNVMGTGIYAASKAYYENLVKTIAIENASLGITANCLQLGYMDGGLTYTLKEEFLIEKIKAIPAQRLGKLSEIASAINFLIDNEYVNGGL